MKILSIELNDFLSYYQQNRFDFGDGPTIIIGQNRTGKSKLFDAIFWALYDKAYQTDFELWQPTKDWKELLVNNYAKSLCTVGGQVKASVVLTFEDEDDNRFVVTREYKIRKKDAVSWDVPRLSTLHLRKTDKLTNNATPYWDKEAEGQIALLFPSNLAKYFLFQGENISQIMSLNNKSDFINALRDLSRIEIFDRARTYADKVFRTMKREFETKADNDNQLQDRKIELSKEIELQKAELEEVNEEFDRYVKDRDTAKEVFSRKNEELKKYEECAQVLNDIKTLEDRKTSKIDLRSQLIESQKRNVFDSWMYAGSQQLFRNFQAIYHQSKIERKIPEPIRQEFVREMLDQEKCLVCGHEAHPGSPYHNQISSLLNDRALDKETELINQLSFVAESALKNLTEIPSDIERFVRKTDEFDDLIRSLGLEIRSKEAYLKTIKPADITDDELKMRNFAQLQIDRDVAKQDLDRLDERVITTRDKVDYVEGHLNTKRKEYDQLVERATNTREKERFKLAEKVQDTVTQFYNNFLFKLISDIEQEANQCFLEMTQKNSALSGRVKVDYDLKEVYTVDEQGRRLFNINQANKVSLQIAFVAAVLSVSNQFWNTYFPFVADAPISALGGNNKVMTIQTMMHIFKQSIIILKDDADTNDPENLRNDIIRNLIQSSPQVQYAYELKTQGHTLEEQHTKIEILKS